MDLRTFVKVSEISNLSDARYCAGMGVNMLGFDLNPGSPRYISPEAFSDITNWISGPKLVGEFGHLNSGEIRLACQDYKLDFIQIEDIDQISDVSAIGLPLIFKLNINQLETLYNFTNLLELIAEFTSDIIISSSNTSLFPSILEHFSNYQSGLRLLRGFDLNPENIEASINQGVFSGIELYGSEEERPGFNDYGQLMDMLEILEEA